MAETENESSGLTDMQSEPPESNKESTSCATGACSLLNKSVLAFLLPFILFLGLDYFGMWPACFGAVCHTCVPTKLALATLIGFICASIYNCFNREEQKPKQPVS
jgi:hypothetical protein